MLICLQYQRKTKVGIWVSNGGSLLTMMGIPDEMIFIVAVTRNLCWCDNCLRSSLWCGDHLSLHQMHWYERQSQSKIKNWRMLTEWHYLMREAIVGRQLVISDYCRCLKSAMSRHQHCYLWWWWSFSLPSSTSPVDNKFIRLLSFWSLMIPPLVFTDSYY